MKTKLLTLLIATGLALCLKAQIANSGFETWTGNDADGWVSTNGLMLLSNPQTVFKDTAGHSGSFACQLQAAHITNKVPGVFIPDYTASIFIGKQVGIQSVTGVPYTSRPASLDFWYKYQGSAGDTCNALVLLTKWNTAASKADTIAMGIFMNSVNVATFVKGSVILNYLGAGAPDTAEIFFSAVMLSSQQAGAKFTIDDVAFVGGNVGLAEQKTETGFSLYPNPAKGVVFLSFDKTEKQTTATIYDLHGREVQVIEAENRKQISINTVNLNAGVYYVKVSNTYKKLVVE